MERMAQAVEKVHQRLHRAALALESAEIAYAVVGGNAVAAWVSQVDEAAVRNTQDVDILLRRSDLERAKLALAGPGFVYRHSASLDMFLDGAEAKARDALHILFAGERVRPEDLVAAPDVEESVRLGSFQAVTLSALVRMKLNSYRLKDKVHLLDLLEVGLIDASWLELVPPSLSARLQVLLDNPQQ